jgi:Ca2+-binding RTX toxin-like protein
MGASIALAGGTLLVMSGGARSQAAATCDGKPATIVGTEGPDTLSGTDGPDVIAGLGGDDVLFGGGGDDSICGGAGEDRLFGEAGGDRLFGDDGRDIIAGGNGNDTADVGDGSSDVIYGELGDDRLTGNGRSIIAYLTAPSGVRVDLANGTATGGDGNDTFTGFPFVIGSDHDDELIGSPQLNIFVGIGGNDTIRGGGGFDVAAFFSGSSVNANLATGRASDGAGEGNDTLVGLAGLAGGTGADTLVGDSHDNFLSGGAGDDTLRGGGGADTLLAGAGNDLVYGEAGNDFIQGGSGVNRLDGGRGANDEVTYASGPTNAGVAVDLARGRATGADFADTVRRIEAVAGSDNDDVLAGDGAGNALIGHGGDDRLIGRKGNDFLNGGTGRDTANGGPGKKDYCLDTDQTAGCEFRQQTQVPASTAAALNSWLGLTASAATPVDSIAENQDEPTCTPFRRGGGLISIAPPKMIKQPGVNDTARWQAVLYRRGSSRPVAKTPLAEGSLGAAGTLPKEIPATWTNPKTRRAVKKTAKRVGPGVYYWKQSVELIKYGPVGSGTVHAYHTPAGAASALPTCDLRGARK